MNEDFSKKNAHCSYCGSRFTEQILWPRKCFRCYNDSWKNPLPVVVLLYVINRAYREGQNSYGILIQQRNIEPKKGGWALTGGYIDAGETWKQAAVREMKEEMNLSLRENNLDLYTVDSSVDKESILVFCKNRLADDWEGYDNYFGVQKILEKETFPNTEVMAWDIMWEPRELDFPTHSLYANKLLRELNKLEEKK